MRKLLLAATLSLSTTLLQGQSPAVNHATGTFDVKVTPTGHDPEPTISSLAIDKQIHGDLEATTKGEMLAAGDQKAGLGGYVAIERVTGKLSGRIGSFALMHTGTMVPGQPYDLKIIVVPGSGTGDLSGIYGTFHLTIDGAGKHSYTFDYAFSTK